MRLKKTPLLARLVKLCAGSFCFGLRVAHEGILAKAATDCTCRMITARLAIRTAHSRLNASGKPHSDTAVSAVALVWELSPQM